MNRVVSRRGFLAAGVAAAGASVAVVVGHRERPRFPARALLSIVPDIGLAAEFGRAASRVVGDDPLPLARRIAPPGRGATWVDRASPDEVRRHLDASIRADFAAGRTVRVSGWVVSLTGARAAVVVSRAG